VRLVPWNGSRPVDPRARMPEVSGLGLDGRTWGNGPGDQSAALTHPDANTLIVLEGSMRLMLPEGRRTLRLEVGDRLERAAGDGACRRRGGAGCH